ncbi:hypothetical protein BKA80DRAFT_282636 [Phyllosticta citrichinensis]
MPLLREWRGWGLMMGNVVRYFNFPFGSFDADHRFSIGMCGPNNLGMWCRCGVGNPRSRRPPSANIYFCCRVGL